MFPKVSRPTITTPPCPSLTIDSGYIFIDSESPDYKDIELTLAIIKPEAYKDAVTIEKIISNEGFKVIQKRIIHLSPEQACDFYFHHYGELGFPKMVVSLSDGPIVALCLARVDAVNYWKTLLGPASVTEAKTFFPTCLRSHFGSLPDNRNGLHGSENLDSAEKEIHFFFPKIIMHPYRTEEQRLEYLKEFLNPTLVKGLVGVCQSKPLDPLIWLADWLLENNPYQPRMHRDLQQIPT